MGSAELIHQPFCHFTYVKLILKPFYRFTYVTAHSTTLPLLHLHHSSFSNPSFASPTSQVLHLIHLASHPWYKTSVNKAEFMHQEVRKQTKDSNIICLVIRYKIKIVSLRNLGLSKNFSEEIKFSHSIKCFRITVKIRNEDKKKESSLFSLMRESENTGTDGRMVTDTLYLRRLATIGNFYSQVVWPSCYPGEVGKG